MNSINATQPMVGSVLEATKSMSNAQLVSSTIELLNQDQSQTTLQPKAEFEFQKNVLSAALSGTGGFINVIA